METLVSDEKTQEQKNEEFRSMHNRPHQNQFTNTSDASLLLIVDEKEARSYWPHSERLRQEFVNEGSFISYWKALRAGRVRISKRQ